MAPVLYTFERRFMRETPEATDRRVDAAPACGPVAPEARGCYVETAVASDGNAGGRAAREVERCTR